MQSVQGFLHQRGQGFGSGPPGLQTLQLQLFRKFQRAVVGRQGEEGVIASHPLVEKAEEVRQLAVHAQGGVHGLVTEGAEIVADVIIGGKTDDQEVRDVVLSQVFLDDRLTGELQLVIGGPGRVLEGVPIPRPGGFQSSPGHMGER